MGALKPDGYHSLLPLRVRAVGLVLLLIGAMAGAHPLDVWHWRNPLPQGNPLNAVTYGNGLYVAVGATGAILTSPDGTNWVPQLSGTLDDLRSVTYGNNQFVAVGQFGAIVTSGDGVLWTAQYAGTFFSLYGVAFGNGVFVAVGEQNMILSSVDGVVWVSRSSGPFNLTGVAFGNHTFVAVGPVSVVLTSTDGLDWFRRPLPVYNQFGTIAYGAGRFVAGGIYGEVWTSENGIAWYSPSESAFDGSNESSIAYGGGTWMAVGSWNQYPRRAIYRSADTTNWVIAFTNSTPLRGVAFGAVGFVAVAADGTLLLSSDAAAWHNPFAAALAVSYGRRDITYGNGGFAAVGNTEVAFSSDGVVWTNSISVTNIGEDRYFYSIAFGNGVYVAGGDRRTVWVSADGLNWTNPAPELEVPYGADVNDIVYANGLFVAVSGEGGSVLTSPDGISWSVRVTSEYLYWWGAGFGNGVYMAVGGDQIGTSTDGANWQVQRVGVGGYLRSIAYGNGRFVIVGEGPGLVSADGTNWVPTADISLGRVAFGAGHFVAVAEDYDFRGIDHPVWTSEDGVNWTAHRLLASEHLSAVAYGNGTFLIGGYQGAILQSDPLVVLNLTMGATPNLTLLGPVNRAYQIECSDRVGAWQPLKTVFATSMPLAVLDTAATNSSRFYRALLQP